MAVAIDWITLTSYDVNLLRTVVPPFVEEQGDYRKIRGYEGVEKDSIFFGDIEVEGRVHAMVIARGAIASLIADNYLKSSQDVRNIKCTRIDLQATEEADLPLSWFRNTEDALKTSQWQREGRRPRVELYSSEGKADKRGQTLGIGSRKTKNGKYVRIYTRLSQDGRPLVRFEIEYHKKMAHSILLGLKTSQPSQYVRAALEEFPKEVANELSFFTIA